MAIDWHYPRADLAEIFLRNFEVGVTNALTLFAPRRMGKTEFLLADLMPMAEKNGYKVIYASFWRFPDSPEICLLEGIEEANRKSPLRDRLLRWADQPMNKVSVKLSANGIQGEFAGIPKERDANQLRAVSAALNEEAAKNKKLLLLLDEVQHLATNPGFGNLIAFLRTFIDQQRATAKVVYTGSSRDGLQRLFRRRKAPLFNSAQQIDLPNMGSGFVRHMLNAFYKASQRDISEAEGLGVFKQLAYSPYHFNGVIQKLLYKGGTDIQAALKLYQEEMDETTTHDEVWDRLKPIDRAALSWIASEKGGIYLEDARHFLASQLGIDNLAVHTIQNSINRLRREGLICNIESGIWVIEDSQFREWVLNNHCG